VDGVTTITVTMADWFVVIVAGSVACLAAVYVGLMLWEKIELHQLRKALRKTKGGQS
jgi:hypothetical protein